MVNLIIKLNSIQIIIPQTVGNNTEIVVHFQEPVSFFIVKHVVPHGKCINENIIVHIAVLIVHPFSNSNIFNDEISKLVSDDSDM